MRILSLLIILLTSPTWATPAWAARMTEKQHPATHAGPHRIGTFEDWTAATNPEAGQASCYAFTRVSSSSPSVAGRGDVVLTVTQRPSRRDAVAITAGFAFGPNAAVQVAADGGTPMEFYTTQRSAFARDGRAAVAAFQKGSRITARSPGPRGTVVVDTFSLRGFSAAYAAIQRACPAKSA